jgi:hypothetical protein
MTNIDLDTLAKEAAALGINVDKLGPAFEKAQKAAEGMAGVSLGKITDQLKTYVSKLTDLSGATSEKLRQSNFDNADSFNVMADGLSKLITMTTKFDAFKNLSVSSGYAVETMGSQFDELLGRFGSWEKASSKLIGSGFSQIASMGEAGAAKFLEAASSAQKLESAYMNLQASTGQMNALFDSNNKLLPNLEQNIGRYASTLTETALITGESTKTVAEYTTKLGEIPGVVGQLIDVGLGHDRMLEGTAAAFTLARGAGRDVNEVYKAMVVAQESLSGSQGRVTDNAKRGAEMFALMNEALKIGGLRFQDTQGFLTDIASNFKLIGDNTQGATNVLARFSGALQNTGLTGKASVEVIENMVNSIKNLDVGTKAMMSSRNGGPGGLQGSFQIDQLMRKGKVDQVSGMLEKTLRQQFGGRIYSQEEAAHSPQAAAQFMRQRSMLQSGAFGGLAKDPESATRLLEALKQGPAATKEALKGAAEATKDVAEKGQELQQKQVSVLNQMNTALDRSVALQEISVLASARDLIGSGNSEASKSYDASKSAAIQDLIQSYTNGPSSLKEQQNTQNRLGAADLVDSGAVFATGIEKGVSQFADNFANVFKTGVKAASEGMQKSKLDKAVASDIAKSEKAAARGSAQHMQNATHQVMKQSPTTLASQIPRATTIANQEVALKPLEIKIEVTRAADTEVTTTTSSPNTTVKDVVSQGKGWSNRNK